TVTDPNKQTVTFSYDDYFHQYKRIEKNALGHTAEYQYDPLMRVVTAIDPNNLKSETAYDQLGRVTGRKVKGESTASYSYAFPTLDDKDDLKTPLCVTEKIESSAGVIQTTSYSDGLGRVVQSKKSVAAEDGTAAWQTVNSTYAPGHIDNDYKTTVTQYLPFASLSDSFSKGTAGTAAVVATSWLSKTGPISEIKNIDGKTAKTVATPWDKQVTDANGNVSTEEFDGLGRRIKLTEPYPIVGDKTPPITAYEYQTGTTWLKKITSPAGYETTFEYDALGRKKSMNDPDRGKTGYEYDSCGNVKIIGFPNSGQILMDYDVLNRVKQKTYKNGNTYQSIYTYGYDTAPNGNGRLAYVVGRFGEAVTTEFYFDKYTYDAFGRPKTHKRQINEIWAEMSYDYDISGLLKSQTLTSKDALGDIKEQSQFKYDNAGRPLEMSYTYDNGATLKYLAKNNRYDINGKLKSYEIVIPKGSSTESFYRAYAYDKALRLETLKTMKGTATMLDLTYGYDNV
ncbi:MAG: hypothetical protein EHM45_25125, partial [Desulfobacteraceae bacterium]